MKTLVLAALLVITGAAGGLVVATRSRAGTATELSYVVHRTNLAFVTTAAGVTPLPTGPLVPGDRILARDDLLQNGSVIGYDSGVCTVTFDNNVVCDYMETLTNQGDIHVAWTFQWPASAGIDGPSVFDGIIDGGTLAHRNAHGSFHAVRLPDGNLQITGTISDSSP